MDKVTQQAPAVKPPSVSLGSLLAAVATLLDGLPGSPTVSDAHDMLARAQREQRRLGRKAEELAQTSRPLAKELARHDSLAGLARVVVLQADMLEYLLTTDEVDIDEVDAADANEHALKMDETDDDNDEDDQVEEPAAAAQHPGWKVTDGPAPPPRDPALAASELLQAANIDAMTLIFSPDQRRRVGSEPVYTLHQLISGVLASLELLDGQTNAFEIEIAAASRTLFVAERLCNTLSDCASWGPLRDDAPAAAGAAS